MDSTHLISSMSLEEKVGQLFMLAFAKNHLSEARILIEDHFVCGSYLSNDNVPSAQAAADLSTQLQAYAAKTRLQLPLLLSPDQEGTWAVMAEDSCPGPGNLALGASHNPDNAYRMYHTIGKELRAVGLNAPFCPCADCNTNPDNAIIGMRAFGERPQLVADMTAAAVRGLKDAGLVASLKHFPGHGDTHIDSHRGIPTVTRSEQELFDIDLYPFIAGIEAGADIVMTSHIIYTALDPDNPATLSPTILQQVLRSKLGFKGVIVSDSMNMKAMKRNYDPSEAAIQALNAGVDIIMLAEEHYDHNESTYLEQQLKLIADVKQAVQNGRLSETRLHEALSKILTLKAGLKQEHLDVSQVGTAEHQALEQELALDAVAILKDKQQLIPIDPTSTITVINTTLRESYEVLGNIRGVGPNQTRAAFDHFISSLKEHHGTLNVVAAEDMHEGKPIPEADVIVAVTENHTLPGMDFDQQSQAPIVQQLLAAYPDRLIVVALRDPYELKDFNEVPAYLCTFSFRPCAAQAAAKVLLGLAPSQGKTPVSVPDTKLNA